MPINQVALSGNLTRDPEVKPIGERCVIDFGIAVNRRVKNQQTDQWEDQPNFFDCSYFVTQNQANFFQGAMFKGTRVSLAGELRQDTWQDKETGQNRSKVKVICHEVVPMVQSQPQGQPQFQQAQQQQYRQQQQYQQQAPQQQYQQPAPQPQYQQQAPQRQAQFNQQPMQRPQAPAPDLYDADIPF